MNTNYLEEAKKFLADTGTTFSIEMAVPQKAPLWSKAGEKHGINYAVTLDNKNTKYTFDFWDSIKNSEIIEAIDNIKGASWDSERVQAERVLEREGIKWRAFQYSKDKKEAEKKKYIPNEYDILACLSPLYEDTLEDFASSFGYDSDSITALKTFEACKEQDRNLRKLWDRSQIERLEEIN